ncbi:hypothetical protein SISNIDRAFT_80368 [Sistotremastrum niveocremeum HHB9708]|uniref:Yeast cell wall synthesis Kre9/Knh1-like N-terminal domain-containing protein n=1 Tax=Sistotremastrum niveocremeum HHB9708 TaxID=1314777 RepID=A0A164UMK7_9AGAM|nr:hypothetical protein SISNIDRAFT_80368 [Sistotremastrum niveocremeum HHB9708]
MFALTLFGSAVFASSAVRALTINTPTNWAGNQTNTVTWTSTAGDPPIFTIELLQTTSPTLAIANNVNTSLGSIALTLPNFDVGPGYSLEFVNVGNISDVLATSGTFTIAQKDQVTSSTSSTSSGSAASTFTGSISTYVAHRRSWVRIVDQHTFSVTPASTTSTIPASISSSASSVLSSLSSVASSEQSSASSSAQSVTLSSSSTTSSSPAATSSSAATTGKPISLGLLGLALAVFL